MSENKGIVDVVGPGSMGLGMAKILAAKTSATKPLAAKTFAAKGLAVIGFDVPPERAKAAADIGVRPAAQVGETFATSDFVVFSVPIAKGVREVVEANAAVLKERAGKRVIVIDTSTSEPDVSRELAGRLFSMGLMRKDVRLVREMAEFDPGTARLMATDPEGLAGRGREPAAIGAGGRRMLRSCGPRLSSAGARAPAAMPGDPSTGLRRAHSHGAGTVRCFDANVAVEHDAEAAGLTAAKETSSNAETRCITSVTCGRATVSPIITQVSNPICKSPICKDRSAR